MAESERARRGIAAAARAGTAGPNRPARDRADVGVDHDRVGLDALAARKPDATGAAAGDEDLARPPRRSGIVGAAGRCASSASASASRCMPPSTSQTPSCSTCATSISVAGARNGEEPQ